MTSTFCAIFFTTYSFVKFATCVKDVRYLFFAFVINKQKKGRSINIIIIITKHTEIAKLRSDSVPLPHILNRIKANKLFLRNKKKERKMDTFR